MKNFFALLRMTLVRKLTPLKVIGFAFRKDKGTFISGSKENNSCAKARELDGRGIAPNADLSNKQIADNMYRRDSKRFLTIQDIMLNESLTDSEKLSSIKTLVFSVRRSCQYEQQDKSLCR